MFTEIWKSLRNQYASRRVETRNAALEDAAQHCDRLATLYNDPDSAFDSGYTAAAQRAARFIRNMKGKS